MNVFLTIIGLFFIVMSFVMTGVGGAHGAGETLPPNRASRVITFVIGVVAIAYGLTGWK